MPSRNWKGGKFRYTHAITADLRREWNVFYDEKGSIGKRYRRMDEAGPPLCITIDSETFGGAGGAIRNWDTLERVRVVDD